MQTTRPSCIRRLDFFETFADKNNATPRYERFYYSKRYIQSKIKGHRTNEARRTIGEALAYLNAIGVDRNELETCIEMDVALFREERDKARFSREIKTPDMCCVAHVKPSPAQVLRVTQHFHSRHLCRHVRYRYGITHRTDGKRAKSVSVE